jgi:glyoxylase-like metal-dependent hydrolase (beta-lactamase superfamily II)
MTAVEILDGIHRIDAEVGGRPLYLFLFIGEERNVLLDAGCAATVEESVLPQLDALGLGPRDLDLLVITHSDFDHHGGAHTLAHENPDLTVACGALDRELVSDPSAIVARRYDAFRVDHGIAYDDETTAWIREMCGSPQPVDAVFAGDETIELGSGFELRVIHVPGHSPGHIALQDIRTGALFSGDCVQGSVYLGLDGMPKLCPTYTDVDAYLQTIDLIAALAPSELHGCHWPSARDGEVTAFLHESRSYVEHVDGLVGACLAEAPAGLTLRELIERVNERLDDPWEPDAAQELVYSLHGHAERLAARAGRNADGHVVYRARKGP